MNQSESMYSKTKFNLSLLTDLDKNASKFPLFQYKATDKINFKDTFGKSTFKNISYY